MYKEVPKIIKEDNLTGIIKNLLTKLIPLLIKQENAKHQEYFFK